tara:strand:- start:27 stop:674 length:648 start_codon:yes stop_codon:yes gene_type:complete
MKLHKEGYSTLISEVIIIFIVNYIAYYNSIMIFWYLILPISIGTFLLSIYFFRVPKRSFERKKGYVYAPCDGKVVVIEETEETEYFKDKRLQVSIFMSPLNVHYNLYPIGGKVTYTKYHPGKYLVAWYPKASSENERSTIVVKDNKTSVLFRQIAGAVAKRIITYSNVGDNVNVADNLGFIKFGSRVDIFLPVGTKINIKLKDKVKAGISIIATY